MEGIIEAFGIKLDLIIIQIFNFAILMGALGYFLYKPILKMLKEREDKISQGLKDAELAAEAKAEAGKEKQIILTTAHQEAEAIGSRAKAAADAKASEIVDQARAKAEQAIKEAEQKSQQLKNQAVTESEKEIAQMAILATEKLLRERL
jgi:F-type H+-transporting ATPase subunit b